MQNFVKPITLASLFLFVQCSFLKLDKETNCLNDKAGCFKEDKTRPQLAANGALAPLQGEVISTLGHVDLLFTEELNNPQPSDFVFSGAANMTVNAVQQLNKFTYRLMLTQNSLTSGPIFLDFPNLKDYNGNKITGSTTVSYVGNVNIPITLNSVSHYGVSNNGGYAQIDVSWRYVYVPPSTPPNSTIYTVRLTTGSEDCNVGTPITPSASSVAVGTAVASYDTTNSTTIANTTHTFSVDTSVITALGAQKILICVANAVQNKYGTDVISLVRDDSAPTTSLTPAAGFYASPRTLTFNCSDNADKVIYTSATTVGTGVDPLASAAADPTFNTTTGAVITGTPYNANAKPSTPYSADPTHTIYKYRCIDQAGNIEAIRTSGVYRIDSTFPTVTLAHVYKSGTTVAITGVSSGAQAYQSADFVWSTNQVNKYWELRVNGTSCGAGGTVVTSGLTTGTANAENTTPIAYNATGIVVGENPLLLCVGNNTTVGTSTVWGQESFSLLRDDTAPSTPVVNIAGGNYGSRPSLVFSCSDNQDKVAFATETAVGSGVPATPALPDFDLNGVTSVGDTYGAPIQPLDATTTTYRWRCIDRAGNKSVAAATATYRIDSILPTITIVSNTRDHLSSVAGYTSTTLSWRSTRGGLPFEIRRNSTNCIDGTLLNSPANVSGTTNADINQNNVSTFDIGNFAAEGEYTLMICVRNYIDQWGFTYKTIRRDNTAPTFAGLTGITSTGGGNFTLNWSAATDGAGSGIAYYNIYRADAFGGPYVTAQHMAAHPATSINVTVPVATNTYYFVAGAVDNAGNETKVTAVVMPTKPTVTLVVQGLDTGGAKTFGLTDGVASSTININTLGAPWATTLDAGATYNFRITAQPAGQVCSLRQRQFGTLSSNITMRVDCVDGFLVGGRYQAVPAAPLNYMLYRGLSSTTYSGGTAINGMAMIGNMLFFVRRDNATDSSIQRCDPANCATSLVTIVNQTTGLMRHLVSDGTNLYVTNPDGSAAAMRIYKYSALLTGQAVPQAEFDPGLTGGFHSGLALDATRNLLYVGIRNVASIKRIHLDTSVVDNISSIVSEHEGMAMMGDDLYVATPDNGNCILRATNAHSASALALYAGSCGATESYADGALLNARFARAHGIVSDGTDLYVAEFSGNRIRRIDVRKGIVSTIAGGGASGTNGTGPDAGFGSLFAMTTDGRKIYASEGGNARLRVVADLGLVGYWPLNAATADYASAVATNYALSATGSFTTPSGRYNETNGSYRFDGSNYLEVADQNQYDLSSEYTISVWINRNAAGVMRIVDKATVNNCDGYNLDIVSDNRLRLLYCIVNGVGQDVLSGTAVPVNQWVHVLATFSSSRQQARLYINGHLDAEKATGAGVSLTNALPLRLGADSSGLNGFSGAMADVRLYNRVLSEGEINELAQDALSTQVGASFNTGATGLLSHYEFSNSNLPGGPIGISLGNGPLPSLTTGKDGDANGAKRYVAVNSQYHYNNGTTGYPIGNQARTQCVWVNPASYPSGNYYGIIQYGSNFANGKSGLFMRENSGSHYLVMPGGGNDHEVEFKLPLNAWTHICGSYDGTMARLYVNGREQGSAGSFPAWSTQTGSLGIGRDLTLTNYFDGKIDDVRIYNNTLSAAQIRQLAMQVPAGLVARYDFNGDTKDASGFGNDAAAATATPTADRLGIATSAYNFSGVSQTITVPHAAALNPAANVSVSVWVRPASLPAAGQVYFIVAKDIYGASGYGLELFNSAGTQRIVWATPGTIGPHYDYQLPLNAYSHIVVTQTGTTINLYVNGALLTPSVVAGNAFPASSTANLLIGGDANQGTGYFQGDIDDVRLYSRVLSAAEIRALAGYHPMQVTNFSTSTKLHLQSETALCGGSACTNNASISSWPDSSGTGNSVSQVTATNQPIWIANGIGGKPSLQFDQSNDFMINASGAGLNTFNFAHFAVIKSSTTNSFPVMSLGTSCGVDDVIFGSDGSGSEYGYGPCNVGLATSGALSAMTTLTPQIFAITGTPTVQGNIYTNGVAGTPYSMAAGAITPGPTLTIGARYGGTGFFYGGLIAEELFFNAPLSATSVYNAPYTDRQIVECYLSAKYSIPLAAGVVCP